MATAKAGLYVVNKKNNCVAIIYRDNRNDYSFPKGHVEKGETFKECAIRETNEEIKRDVKLLDIEPIIEHYETDKGEKCVCYMFYALDLGVSDNKSLDTHKNIWVPIDEVENILTYDNLKESWKTAKNVVLKILNEDIE